MNIEDIRAIVNNDNLPKQVQKNYILSIIAKDEDAIPLIMEILNFERQEKKELILDSNMELSRALITLQDPNIGKDKPKPYIELAFVVGEIKKHYLKWQDKIRCCFKVAGLP
jgi:hypothetical protein